MEKFTSKQLKWLVKCGAATDVTNANSVSDIPENYRNIGYAEGINGINGALFLGDSTGKLYAITGRCSAIFIFM